LLERARAFARCLDRNDFAGAREFPHPECPTSSELAGPGAILKSYESNYLSVRPHLDELEFASSVTAEPGGTFRIHYVDKIRKCTARHEHRRDPDR
jgi:hypothetical protein